MTQRDEFGDIEHDDELLDAIAAGADPGPQGDAASALLAEIVAAVDRQSPDDESGPRGGGPHRTVWGITLGVAVLVAAGGALSAAAHTDAPAPAAVVIHSADGPAIHSAPLPSITLSPRATSAPAAPTAADAASVPAHVRAVPTASSRGWLPQRAPLEPRIHRASHRDESWRAEPWRAETSPQTTRPSEQEPVPTPSPTDAEPRHTSDRTAYAPETQHSEHSAWRASGQSEPSPTSAPFTTAWRAAATQSGERASMSMRMSTPTSSATPTWAPSSTPTEAPASGSGSGSGSGSEPWAYPSDSYRR